MTDAIWYIYQNSTQSGPFSHAEIKSRLDAKEINSDAYLFKAGWKDWRLVDECRKEFLGPPATPPVPKAPAPKKAQKKFIERAPRATIEGQVIFHNNGQLSFGSGVNISTSGMFVQTDKNVFKIDEKLKVTCRLEARSIKPFNAQAKVVRFSNSKEGPVGYGLQFIDLDSRIKKEIQDELDRLNLGQGS